MLQAATWEARSPSTWSGTRTFLALVGAAGLVELERRDAQALGEDLGRVGRVAARHPAAHVGLVADGAGEGHQPLVYEERRDDEDVRQVHAARERVVHD
jgi:hypothetical protein